MPLKTPLKMFNPRQPENPWIQRPRSDKNGETHPSLAVMMLFSKLMWEQFCWLVVMVENKDSLKYPAWNIQIQHSKHFSRISAQLNLKDGWDGLGNILCYPDSTSNGEQGENHFPWSGGVIPRIMARSRSQLLLIFALYRYLMTCHTHVWYMRCSWSTQIQCVFILHPEAWQFRLSSIAQLERHIFIYCTCFYLSLYIS